MTQADFTSDTATSDQAHRLAVALIESDLPDIAGELLSGVGTDGRTKHSDEIERGLLLMEVPPMPVDDAHAGRWQGHAQHLERKLREFIRRYSRVLAVLNVPVLRFKLEEAIDQEIGKAEDVAEADGRESYERLLARDSRKFSAPLLRRA